MVFPARTSRSRTRFVKCCTRLCQGCLALVFLCLSLWATLTHLYNERNFVPTSDGRCPYPNKSPFTVTLSTYWISFYDMSLKRAGSDDVIWTPKMFFTNRFGKDTVCLDDTTNDCYTFTLRDSAGEGLTDGSCNLYWQDQHIKRIDGAFGESASFQFGRGC